MCALSSRPLRITTCRCGFLEAVETVNDTRRRAMARKVSSIFAGVLRGKTVAVLGLTFKPNTDDVREAPCLALITALQDMGARVRAYDPAGMEQAKQVLVDVTYCRDPYDCVEEADAVVIVTEWEQFRALDLERVRDLMACPVMVDLRKRLSPGRHEEIRVCLYFGRASSDPAACQSRWRASPQRGQRMTVRSICRSGYCG